MSQLFKVFAVDDDPVVLGVMQAILEPDCQLQVFASAEACLERLESEQPDLFFLDVNLPGINGFALCRAIRSDTALGKTPVIFVSGCDSIEERINGYDAGGEDFIVKPFEPEELLRKLLVAQHMVLDQRGLAEQIADAEMLSSLVMANMDETGILLQFMSKLIAMESAAEISTELLELLRRYGLDGVVQTRIGGVTHTQSAAGSDLPLEVSVIAHVRDQGRIVEVRRRCVHNFERVTLMVSSLPLENADFCGRLRDHLSVAAQGADSRLRALHSEDSSRRAQEAILGALESVGNSISELRAARQDESAMSSQLIRVSGNPAQLIRRAGAHRKPGTIPAGYGRRFSGPDGRDPQSRRTDAIHPAAAERQARPTAQLLKRYSLDYAGLSAKDIERYARNVHPGAWLIDAERPLAPSPMKTRSSCSDG